MAAAGDTRAGAEFILARKPRGIDGGVIVVKTGENPPGKTTQSPWL
jgi:hypothetical protein